MSLTITHERPEHGQYIESLLDLAFGPARTQKTSYRFRQGVDAIADLSLVALNDMGELVGTVRHWPVQLGTQKADALLLGPIAVHPSLQGSGLGQALMETVLNMARQQGHKLVILVGDPNYYSRFGFVPAANFGITMADEVQSRLQVLPLVPLDTDAVAGEVFSAPGGWLRPGAQGFMKTPCPQGYITTVELKVKKVA